MTRFSRRLSKSSCSAPPRGKLPDTEGLLREAFDDIALVIGGVTVIHHLDDDLIWTLMKRLDHTDTQQAPNKLYRCYVCVNAHQEGHNQCQTRSVSAAVIEQAVIDWIRGIAANPMVVEEVPGSLITRVSPGSKDSNERSASWRTSFSASGRRPLA